MSISKILKLVGFACAAFAMAAGPAVAAPKVRLGYVHVELVDVPLFHGVSRGIFAEHGVDLELIKFDNGTQINQALAGGRIDAALAGAAVLQNFAVQGNGVIVAPSYMDSNDLYAIPSSGVKSVADLAGKQVAFPLATTAHILVDWALAEAGMTMSSIKVVNTSYASTASAVISGAVAAAATHAGLARVIRREVPDAIKLADLKKYVPNRVVLGGLVASNAFYNAEKATLANLVIGYVRAYREVWLDKKAQREVYDKFYAKDETFQEYENNIAEIITFPTPEQWLKYLDDGSVAKWAVDVAKTLERAGALKTIVEPKQFLDASFYREAVRRTSSSKAK